MRRALSLPRHPTLKHSSIGLRHIQRRHRQGFEKAWDRRDAGKTVRIWSGEHGAYWQRTDTGGGAGYIGVRPGAGIWSLRDAYSLSGHCGPEKKIIFEFVIDGDTGDEARPEAEWHEDIGQCLWWQFPVCEAPYVGSPLDTEWPGYHTHWTRLPPIPHKPQRGRRT